MSASTDDTRTEYTAGRLSLRLLSSRANIDLINALRDPRSGDVAELDPDRKGFGSRIAEFEDYGLLRRIGDRIEPTDAFWELLQVWDLLERWIYAGRPVLPITRLISLVHLIWAANLLVRLALGPSTSGQLAETLADASATTIKRYLRRAQDMELVAKAAAPSGRRRRPGARPGRPRYRLTRRACLLIRPLSAALRLEERHFGDFALPPSPEVYRAGMAVLAQLLTPPPDKDLDILFEVLDDAGGRMVIKRAIYSRGRLHTVAPSPHSDSLPCIAGTVSAWYDFLIDLNPSGLLAHNIGAKSTLRRLKRDLTY